MNRLGPGRQLLLGLTIFLLGAGVAVVTSDEDHSKEGERPALSGPNPGQQVDEYLADRRGALADADGTHSAVVSFASYLDDDEAADLVRTGVEVWLVAGMGGTPEQTEDVDAWRSERAATARTEADELDSLIPTAEDPEFVRQYQRDRDRLRRMADRLDAGDAVVFAVVVRASADALRAVSGRQGIRLVDPIDPLDARATPRGLRPEERVVVGQPPERP